MILTEAEAATKRCPMSFAAAQGVSMGGYTQVGPAPAIGYGMGGAMAIQTAPLNCIGSACMAWRVAKEAVPAYPGVVAGRDGATTYYQAGTERPEQPAKGSCGLARV